MKIPEDLIQQIREAVDITELIGAHVQLKKRGKTFLGLCPFHQEKTPSFSVDPDRGFYHCFGCGEGGNAFTFLMKTEGIGFPEAVRVLAEKTGIALPDPGVENKISRETEQLYHVNQFAAEFFSTCLYQTNAGKKALDYFLKRGLSMDMAKAFEIGYAPNVWDGIIQAAGKKAVSLEGLQKAGLIIPRKNGKGYYDRFRGRLMFPVKNTAGRIVGFGGRILIAANNSPKYLNSPESAVYRKSRLLYGLFQAKSAIRSCDKVFLVEGYTDVIRMHQEGFENTAATSGTALTDEQAKMISRYTKNAELVFDGDSAGFSAALRGVDILLKAGLSVSIAVLPKAKDPDTFLSENGAKAMSDILKNSKEFVDFRLERLREANRFNSPEDKAKAAHALLETISNIHDPIKRELAIKDLSEKMGIDESTLKNQLKSGKRINDGNAAPETAKKRLSGEDRAERILVFLVLSDEGKWIKKIFQSIEPSSFRIEKNKIIMDYIYHTYSRGGRPDFKNVTDHFSDNPELMKILTELMALSPGDETDLAAWGMDCVIYLKESEIKNSIQSLRNRLKNKDIDAACRQSLEKQYLQCRNTLKRLNEDMFEIWKKEVDI